MKELILKAIIIYLNKKVNEFQHAQTKEKELILILDQLFSLSFNYLANSLTLAALPVLALK